ncbi:hypothetical protein [Spirillospora sp. NBC_01491]|uniref:hypothetical protein n=1 Tax=Spirillospora sp. NBC_01491 TaxID=2976007 RepID=UPI002E303AA3|nr:hypothetical protein [Spirillospora sp. NBC_01491]
MRERNPDGTSVTSVIARLAAGGGLLMVGISGIVTGIDDLAGHQVRTYLEVGEGGDPAQLVLYPVLLGLDTLASLALVWAGIHGVCALPVNEGWRRCRKGVVVGALVKVAALVTGLLVLRGSWRGLYLDPGWPAADRIVLAGAAVLLVLGVLSLPRPWPRTPGPLQPPAAPDDDDPRHRPGGRMDDDPFPYTGPYSGPYTLGEGDDGPRTTAPTRTLSG